MDRQYYQEYFFIERNHWWFRVRESIIVDHLKRIMLKSGVPRILNIGAAAGASTNMLEQFGNVISTEYDELSSVTTSKELEITVINCSILKLPFGNNSFDLVCAFDVIEHVEDDLEAINEMKRVCRSGGIICITVPALMMLWSHHDVVNNHYRRYRRGDIKRLFKAANDGEIIQVTYFNTILFPLILIFRLLSRVLPDPIIRHGAGSDFTVVRHNNPINGILGAIFGLERIVLRRFTFNVGTSILFSWRKSYSVSLPPDQDP